MLLSNIWKYIEERLNYRPFPDVRRFENFLFDRAAFDLEIRFRRLPCRPVLKVLVSTALRNILRDFSQWGRNQSLEKC